MKILKKNSLLKRIIIPNNFLFNNIIKNFIKKYVLYDTFIIRYYKIEIFISNKNMKINLSSITNVITCRIM